MTMHGFKLDKVDPSWRQCILTGLAQMQPAYLQQLACNKDWLPGADKIFNAFSLPVNKVNYLLFGESPYPRRESANGYAFWDAAVQELWSQAGLSKRINRATSLRNIMKMLLVAENALKPTQTSQTAIAALNKEHYVQTGTELFTNFLQHGFLLLNATLVLQAGPPIKDAKAWYPFMQHILAFLLQQRPQITLILLGRIANPVDKIVTDPRIKRVYAEHPYNHTFITNKDILHFFKPLHLLRHPSLKN